MVKIYQHVQVRSGRGNFGNVPATPENLVASATGQTTVSISWSAPSVKHQKITGYDLQRSTDVGFSNVASLLTNSSQTSYSDSNLSAGATYYYRVRSYNGTNYSEYTSTSVATDGVTNEWTSDIPNISFTEGVAGTFPLTPYLASGGVGITVSDPTGTTGDNVYNTEGLRLTTTEGSQSVDYDGAGALNNFPGVYLSAVGTVVTGPEITTLTLSGGGAGKPWTFGQAFKKNDVRTGYYITASNLGEVGGPTSFQADVRNYWYDGSVKFAVLSGIGGTSAVLAATTSAPTGSALTQAAMVAALPASSSVTVGTQTVNLATLLNTAPQRTVYAGPVMANWIFRQALTVGTGMSLWVDVRYYSGGAIEIFPWVENGVFETASPTNYVGTCSVVIGGSTVFGPSSIDFKALTRIPLLSGTSFAYWANVSDPQITPQHNVTYLKSTKLVPNYKSLVHTSAFTSARPAQYVPNLLLTDASEESTGAAGGHGSIDAISALYYISSGATQASYRSAMAAGFTSGSYSIHWRKSATQEPFTIAEVGQIRMDNMPSIAGGVNAAFGETHAAGFAVIPYLISGRWWFVDELLFVANDHYLENAAGGWSTGFTTDFICAPWSSGAARLAAWCLRALVQALGYIPDNHPRRAELITKMENNCQYHRIRYVDGGSWKTASYGTADVSPQGFINAEYDYDTSATHYVSNSFMMNYMIPVWGHAYELELPVSSARRADHLVFRNHLYKHIVGRAGLLSGSGWNWRHFAMYWYPCANKAYTQQYTHAQSYAAATSIYGWTAASQDDSAGQFLFEHSGEGSLTNSGSLPYASSAYAGLAMAAGDGYSDATVGSAVAALARIEGASNFYTTGTVNGLDYFHRNQDPSFAVDPR